jgi:hypothetical protein
VSRLVIPLKDATHDALCARKDAGAAKHDDVLNRVRLMLNRRRTGRRGIDPLLAIIADEADN